MDFNAIKELKLENSLQDIELTEELDQIDEISNYDQVVTYYRHLKLDPYKLRGIAGAKLRARIKNSPAFKAWLQLKAHNVESVESNLKKTLIETIKDAKKQKTGKTSKVTFYGYPNKNATTSNTDLEQAHTPNNYLDHN
jgi:hypothetical protein